MSLERRLRRRQKQNGSGALDKLQAAMKELEKVQDLGQGAQQIQTLVSELTELRESLKDALTEVASYRHELNKQRAVMLRLVFGGEGEWITSYLDSELQYRAEYDAIFVLGNLVTWAKEAP